MTLAALVALAVIAAGAAARTAYLLSRRSTVVGRFAGGDHIAGDRHTRAGTGWRPAEPPARVRAALDEADLPVPVPMAWTAWVGALAVGRCWQPSSEGRGWPASPPSGW